MSLVTIVIVLVIVGVVLWLINAIVPMPAWLKTVINAIVGLFVFLWLLQSFGLIPHVVRLR